jgi:hypothetical protein
MSDRPGSVRGNMIAVVVATTLVAGAALLYLTDTLVLGMRPGEITANLLVNEALLLASLALLQGLLLWVLSARYLTPLRRLAALLGGSTTARAVAGEAPAELGEVTEVYKAGLSLMKLHQEGRRALEELDRVRYDSARMLSALSAQERTAVPSLACSGETLAELSRQLEQHLQDLNEWREENAAVALQVQTEGREAVLAAREASNQSESAYLESGELGVALRDLARVIGDVRPILEAERAPGGPSDDGVAGLREACRMLAEIAERHRGFGLRISREWARGPGQPPEYGVALLEDLRSHLDAAEACRVEAEARLANVPVRATGDLPPQLRSALKKLLQSAEISSERLVRLTGAAERASSAARRAAGLAERELQSLEALGVRLEGDTGPLDSAETLGESDFVVEPER